MVKLFSYILLTIFLGWGSKMKVVESTSRDWVGGLQESGYGTDFEVSLQVKAGSNDLKIEELWVGDVHMKVRVNAFEKDARVKVRAGYTTKPDANHKMALSGADNAPKPFNYKGEGLLKYSCKGKILYVVIPEFKKLEKIIYPQ